MQIKYNICKQFISNVNSNYLSKQAVFIVSILMNRISVAWAKTWNHIWRQAINNKLLWLDGQPVKNGLIKCLIKHHTMMTHGRMEI